MMFESGQRFGSSNNGIVGKQNEMERVFIQNCSHIFEMICSRTLLTGHILRRIC